MGKIPWEYSFYESGLHRTLTSSSFRSRSSSEKVSKVERIITLDGFLRAHRIDILDTLRQTRLPDSKIKC